VTESRILTVGPPLTFRHQVARALGSDPEKVEWMPTVAAAEGSTLEGSNAPNLVVLSPGVKDPDAFGLAEFLSKRSPTTAVLLVRDRMLNGELPAAMRAGVRDVVDMSKGNEELREALGRALEWSESLRSAGRDRAPEAEVRAGKLYSVFSSKGGTGKTFLVSNLAAAIADETKQDTALVDFDVDLGDVFAYFGKEPTKALEDIVALGDETERSAVVATGTQLGPHLYGFGSVHDPAAGEIGGESAGKVLRTLRSTFSHVLVDATADYSDAALAAFDLSEGIFLIAGLDVVGIRHLSLALQTLLSLGFPRERFRVVLNRADSKVGLSPTDIERVMKVSVDTLIPSSRLVPVSLNRGVPVVLDEPRSEVSKSVRAMAKRLTDVPASGQGRRRLFGRQSG
jgi:pilus assembly protein CpaE